MISDCVKCRSGALAPHTRADYEPNVYSRNANYICSNNQGETIGAGLRDKGICERLCTRSSRRCVTKGMSRRLTDTLRTTVFNQNREATTSVQFQVRKATWDQACSGSVYVSSPTGTLSIEDSDTSYLSFAWQHNPYCKPSNGPHIMLRRFTDTWICLACNALEDVRAPTREVPFSVPGPPAFRQG